MLIRARCKADIQNLFDANKNLPSIEHPTSDEARDYRWRMSISKADWVQLAARLAEAVDYSNFKNAVHDQPDQLNKNRAYLAIWRIIMKSNWLKSHRNRPSKNDPGAEEDDRTPILRSGHIRRW